MVNAWLRDSNVTTHRDKNSNEEIRLDGDLVGYVNYYKIGTKIVLHLNGSLNSTQIESIKNYFVEISNRIGYSIHILQNGIVKVIGGEV